jgi:hypothetical protein
MLMLMLMLMLTMTTVLNLHCSAVCCDALCMWSAMAQEAEQGWR